MLKLCWYSVQQHSYMCDIASLSSDVNNACWINFISQYLSLGIPADRTNVHHTENVFWGFGFRAQVLVHLRIRSMMGADTRHRSRSLPGSTHSRTLARLRHLPSTALTHKHTWIYIHDWKNQQRSVIITFNIKSKLTWYQCYFIIIDIHLKKLLIFRILVLYFWFSFENFSNFVVFFMFIQFLFQL